MTCCHSVNRETDLTMQRNFSTLSTYSLLDRKQTLTFVNFEDGHHFQDDCHEVTSSVGITAQLLFANSVSMRTIFGRHTLQNTYFAKSAFGPVSESSFQVLTAVQYFELADSCK